jgi:hypothetical protein
MGNNVIKNLFLLLFILLFSVSVSHGNTYKVKEFYVRGSTPKAALSMQSWIMVQDALKIHIVSIYSCGATDINYPSWFVVYYED